MSSILEPDSRKRAPATSPLGIICGGGALPFAVADAALKHRPVLLLAIEGWADTQRVAAYPHEWVALGQFGRLCRLARDAGVKDLVCVGALVRPALRALRLDWATVRILPRLYRMFRGGDDRLLSGIASLFEEQGFRMIGAHEVAPEIAMPEGVVGHVRPSARNLEDALRGFDLIDALGPFDMGQAVVIADHRVLAAEAAEGTDAMLARVAELRSAGRISLAPGAGVLVKAPKPGQDERIDLPSIGPATVAAIKHAGLAGIAVAAGTVIVADAAGTAEAADAAGIFIVGVRRDAPAAR